MLEKLIIVNEIKVNLLFKPLGQEDGEFYIINIATIYGTKIENIRIQINQQF